MHLDDQILNNYIDNELSEPWKTQVEEHLNWCEACKNRFNELNKLHEIIQNATLTEEEISTRQNRVRKYIDKNVINKKRFSIKRLLKKIPTFFYYFVPATCLAFCFCLIIFNSPEKKKNLVPSINEPVNLSIENITPVRTSDNYTTSETLSKYSLDEILKYLDESGYEVDLRVKSLTPIPTGEVIKISETTGKKIVFPQYAITPISSTFSLKTNNLFLFKATQETGL